MYKFGKPEHHPADELADVYRTELLEDLSTPPMSRLWQLLCAVMLSAIAVLLIALYVTRPDESAAPQAKPSPTTGATVGNSATFLTNITMSTMPAGYANLGKPVTIERFENALAHMADMYPGLTPDEQKEIVRAAAKLVEEDNPDAIWGRVNARPPLHNMDWVSRMRLGAALLAEENPPMPQFCAPSVATLNRIFPHAPQP